MDVAALGSMMSQLPVQLEASTKIAKMAMDTIETRADGLFKMIEESPNADLIDATPHLGKSVDLSV